MYHGPGDIRVEEVADPTPLPGEVVIEVSRNGICGSDLHTYVGADMGSAALHVPGVVLGHEFAGVVCATGDEVDDLTVGALVAASPIVFCGDCSACRLGRPNLCRQLGIHGGYRLPLHGGLARYVAVARSGVYRAPEGLDPVTASLAEPVAVAVHAVRRAPALLGAAVLVLGAGPIGLAIASAAHAAGAALVIVSEPSAARRRAAEVGGWALVLDPTVDDLRGSVRAEAPSGVDVAFDTTAVHQAFNTGISLLAPGAMMVSVAGWQEPAQIDMGRAMVREVDLSFVMTYQPDIDFPIALDLLGRGVIDVDTMVSDHVALDDLVDRGLEELLHHHDRHVKILVDPSSDTVTSRLAHDCSAGTS